MVRIFWVACPVCEEEFHAHYGELRHSGVKLLCPRCGERFLPEEAANVMDVPASRHPRDKGAKQST